LTRHIDTAAAGHPCVVNTGLSSVCGSSLNPNCLSHAVIPPHSAFKHSLCLNGSERRDSISSFENLYSPQNDRNK